MLGVALYIAPPSKTCTTDLASLMEDCSLGASVKASCHPSLVRGQARHVHGTAPVQVGPTQLEIAVSCRVTGFKEVLDVVILGSAPHLTFKHNGPGDVVQ